MAVTALAHNRIRILRPLRIRDFALLWTGMTVSFLGDGLYTVAIAWQVYTLSNAPTALAVVGVAWMLPQAAYFGHLQRWAQEGHGMLRHFTERQRDWRDRAVALREQQLAPNARRVDETGQFPRDKLEIGEEVVAIADAVAIRRQPGTNGVEPFALCPG